MQIAECEPEGVVEVFVQRFVEDARGGNGGGEALNLGQGANGFEADLRMVVIDAGGDECETVAQTGMPMIDDAESGGSNVMVSGIEKKAQEVGIDDVESLIGPKGFEAEWFDVGRLRVELRNPTIEFREDGIGAELLQLSASVMPHPGFARFEEFEKFGGRFADDFRAGDEGSAFGGDAPDASVGVIAAGIAEVDFAVLNDGVVPVGDINCAVGTHFDVDGAEGDVRGFDEFGLFAGGISGGTFGEDEAADAVGAEIVGDDVSLPIGGEMGSADDFDATMFWAAGIETVEDTFGTDGGEEGGSGKDVVDPFTECSVGGEGLPPFVEVMSPGIDESACEDFELTCFGAEVPDASAVESTDAVGSFDVAVDVDRLIEVEESFGSPAESVEDVMGVFGSESGKDDFASVALAVAIGVGDVDQFGTVGDVGPSVTRFDAGRNQEAVGEDAGIFGDAVAVIVLEDDDFVVGFGPDWNLRIDPGTGDPEPPGGIEIHLDGLGEEGIGGVEVDLEPIGDGEGLPFEFRIGDGDVFQFPLSEGGELEGQADQEETEIEERPSKHGNRSKERMNLQGETAIQRDCGEGVY